ncbi:sensor histidine kinase [Rhodococcus sp. 06-156-3C]|uniref:sensor histidine kinase n=1 Tax=Nocardiaceae TaxID=85025 RepID=UPI0006917FC8|nr:MULTISPECIES: HAMP domain-containing sensor histidine kinase [Rhodococcus]OZD08710.1 sensor histidine kinase [Rhodococcus sp. 06-156-4C]OZD17288.1 sensor histidine kinase [Rhodococcus sp. 06-156-3C]OZD18625.1 sensor histidine kinase [Rhodococcus sp. 06-156-4a]OZD25032.1 sensor histidine kinase [Rhodococcus sp. 06-156-3b]OZD34190.1 sensor histidine kinase [Rhodococcus sp. 06-156-3]
MRTRLVLVLVVLGTIALTAFAVPLALTVSESRTRAFVAIRDSDVQRFSVIAEDYVTTGELTALQLEADSYEAVYGDPVLVVSTRGIDDYSAGMNVDGRVQDAIARGLRNERSTDVDRLTPLGSDPVLFVRPIGTGAQVNGAVVIEASTLDARGDILRGWLVIAGGFALAMAMFVGLSLAVGRWVLSPLSSLASSMEDFETRLPFRRGDVPSPRSDRTHPVDAAGGPPEIRSLARTFGSLMDSVVGAVDSQERLIAETAHQLRNPLTALQFRIDMLAVDAPERLRDDVQIVAAEAERLHVILDELLSYASAQTPVLHGGGVAEDCGAHAVLLDRVDFWSSVVRERGALIEVGSDLDHETRVRIRESDLTQILDVLFDNATKHAGEGVRIVAGIEAAPPVLESGDRDRDRVLVTVEDTGVGVDTAALGSLTDPFVTTGNGAGLGLSIVAALVRRANGELEFDRSLLGGLRVTVVLPRSPRATRTSAIHGAEYIGAPAQDPESGGAP